jgi:hypothetical protein
MSAESAIFAGLFVFNDLTGAKQPLFRPAIFPLAAHGTAKPPLHFASAALANAFLRAVVLLLNLAVKACGPRGLGHAWVRQSLAGRRQVPAIQRLP